MSSYTAYLIETFITLVVVCALAIVVLWFARRAGVARGSGPIELYGHLQLEARRAIYLVKVGDQIFVVGVGESGFTKLGEIPVQELPAIGPARSIPFAEVLGRALGRRTGGATVAKQTDNGEGHDGEERARTA